MVIPLIWTFDPPLKNNFGAAVSDCDLTPRVRKCETATEMKIHSMDSSTTNPFAGILTLIPLSFE